MNNVTAWIKAHPGPAAAIGIGTVVVAYVVYRRRKATGAAAPTLATGAQAVPATFPDSSGSAGLGAGAGGMPVVPLPPDTGGGSSGPGTGGSTTSAAPAPATTSTTAAGANPSGGPAAPASTFDFSGNTPIAGVPVSGGVASSVIQPFFTGSTVTSQPQTGGAPVGTPIYAYTASAVPQGASLPGETQAQTQQFLGGLPPGAVIYGPGPYGGAK